MNILDFIEMKKNGEKISMITCYDYWSSVIVNDSNIDCVLVGDSGAMVMQGYNSTVKATVEMIAYMTSAVRRGTPDKFIIADMPFLSFRKGVITGMEAVEKLMQAGANAIKLEGVDGHEELISQIVKSGVPVMGHLGLTPQSVNGLGGHKVQGREDEAAIKMLNEAKKLESLGCFSLVLECVPRKLASEITKKINITTIGIGAGSDTDGQVLVMQDMLGMNKNFRPKFLREYQNGFELLKESFNSFHADVRSKKFPNIEESYD